MEVDGSPGECGTLGRCRKSVRLRQHFLIFAEEYPPVIAATPKKSPPVLPKSYTFSEIKQKMANYCVYQDRCHQEVEQKMRDFLLVPEAKEEILLYLMRENYLNEERFTRSYIRGKFYMKGWGKNKIRNHLKFKGVPEKLINASFDEIEEEDYVETLKKGYEKYYHQLTDAPPYQRKSKTIKYLLSKGFEYEVIQSVMEDYPV